MLDSGMWQISEDCPKLTECLPTLVRDPKNTEDVLKIDYSENYVGDDPADSARMGLQYMLGAARKPAEVTLQENAQLIEDPTARFFYLYKERAKLAEKGGIVKQPSNAPWMSKL